MNTRTNDQSEAEWRRICSAMTRDSVRIRVPRAFLSTLTLLFDHVVDAMAGDDRPDHGLARMRQGRAHYRIPFHFLCVKLGRAEKRMSEARHRQAARVFHRYLELSEERERKFRKAIQERARTNAQDAE